MIPLATLQLILNAVWILSGSVDPTVAAGVPAPIGSLYLRTTSTVVYVKTGALDTDWLDVTILFSASIDGFAPVSPGTIDRFLRADVSWEIPPANSPGWFGSGVNGALVINGGTVTQLRDMFWTTGSIINGGMLITGGYRTYFSDLCTLDAISVIRNNGGNGVGNVPGNAGAGVTVASGQAGGVSGTTGAGGASGGRSNQPFNIPLSGATSGQGGAGGAGPLGAGGASGAYLQAPISSGGCWAMPWLSLMTWAKAPSANWPAGEGGGGGGGGGGGALGIGGAGGGGGGGISICARQFANDGSVQAHGGSGGNALNANGGGGGGGGGGKIVVAYRDYSGAGTLDAAGGIGGTPTGTGVAGSDGFSGFTVLSQI